MGKALARFKRFMILLQTGWSILGITLVLILIIEVSLRVTFALRDHLTRPTVARSANPGGRLRRGDLAHRALSRDRIARGALATLRLLPAEGVPRQDDCHRARRIARHLAASRTSRGTGRRRSRSSY